MKNKKLLIGIILILFLIVIFVIPHEVWAQDATEAPRRAFGDIGSLKSLINDPGSISRRIWNLSMSLANYILIAALLAMAFSTSLRIDSYSVKKILPNVLLGFILANSSLFIITVGIDISHVLSREIIRFSGTGILDSYIQTFTDMSSGILTRGQGGVDFIFRLVVNSVMMFAYIAAFLVQLCVFVIRFFAIQIYIGFAPIAFMSIATPATRGIFQKWGEGFISWLMLMPISLLCLWMGMYFLNVLGGGIVSFIIGIFFIVSSFIVPFKIKGLGANLLVQARGIMGALGMRAVSSVAKNEGTSRTARAGRAIATGIAGVSNIPAALKYAKTDTEREFQSLGIGKAGEWLGNKNLQRRHEAKAINDYASEQKGVNFADWNFRDSVAGNAALGEVMSSPFRIMELHQAFAEQISSNPSLASVLGYEGRNKDEIAEIFRNDGAAFVKAFGRITGQVDKDGNLNLGYNSKERFLALSKILPKEGFIGSAMHFDMNTGALIDGAEAQANAKVEALTDKYDQILNSLKASKGKDFASQRYMVKLMEGGQFTDAILGGVGPVTLENMSKALPSLSREFASKLPKDFDFNAKLTPDDKGLARTLKLIKLGGTEGYDAMKQGMMNYNQSLMAFNSAVNRRNQIVESSVARPRGGVNENFVAGLRSRVEGSSGGVSSRFEDTGPRFTGTRNVETEVRDIVAGRAAEQVKEAGSQQSSVSRFSGSPFGPTSDSGNESRQATSELRDTARKLSQAAEGISSAAAGLGNAVDDMRRGNASAIDAANQVANAASTLSSSAEQVDSAARQTSETAKQTQSAAEELERSAEKTQESVKKIDQASENLGDIDINNPPAPPAPPQE